MNLTRIVVPATDLTVSRVLGDAYALHVAVMQGFPRPSGRVLYRVEPQGRDRSNVTLVVQSEHVPDWKDSLWLRSATVERKSLGAIYKTLANGQRLRFRLRANPTRKVSRDGGASTRIGLVTEADQVQWLQKKGMAGGFKIEQEDTETGSALCVRVIDENERIGRKNGSALTFRSIMYDGVLAITDAELFQATLSSGIGSGKAFGFGLLSVARG